MAELSGILVESLRTLRQEPSLFIPKILSTSAGAIWFIALVAGPRTGQALTVYSAAGVFVALLGVFASIMMASMVRKKGSKNALVEGFRESLGYWKRIVLFFLLVLLIGLVIYIPLAIGFTLYYFAGLKLYFLIGGVLSLLLLLLSGFLLYFFPISLLEKGSVLKGLRDSANVSRQNWREVGLLTVFSFMLLGLASFSGNTGMELFGYAGFFALRLLSGIVTTYIFVVSPEYYLSE